MRQTEMHSFALQACSVHVAEC